MAIDFSDFLESVQGGTSSIDDRFVGQSLGTIGGIETPPLAAFRSAGAPVQQVAGQPGAQQAIPGGIPTGAGIAPGAAGVPFGGGIGVGPGLGPGVGPGSPGGIGGTSQGAGVSPGSAAAIGLGLLSGPLGLVSALFQNVNVQQPSFIAQQIDQALGLDPFGLGTEADIGGIGIGFGEEGGGAGEAGGVGGATGGASGVGAGEGIGEAGDVGSTV